MARVPFIGPLFWREYLALVGSFLFILLEGVIRVITLGLPGPIIKFCYNSSKTVFKFLAPAQDRRQQRTSIAKAVAHAADFTDLCALFGYYAEEHVVQTKDGYLLGLHRLAYKKGEERMKVNAGEGSVQKRVVYLHHGLLMNSEVWVCLTDEARCLPFALVEAGYDVWLGNNRGNKYSKKSTRLSPNSNAFWDFSIDEFAFHDIPDSIDYILDSTAQKSLSYIGFSQGTAQAFATLSIHPTLNYKVDVFIALAPAMSPAGLSNGVVDALMKTSPSVVFLTFGRRSILSSATMWQSILYPPIFVQLIDTSLRLLFNWTGVNINPEQKLAAYPHLYSFTSTKSVVHWFQIIRNRCFQMYDDDVQTPLPLVSTNSDRYYKPTKFPTRNIKTPIVLLYGGSDSLVDINVMLKELPAHTVAHGIRHYEHLDFLWGRGVEQLVFPQVFKALGDYSALSSNKSKGLRKILDATIPQYPPSYSDDEWRNAGLKHPGPSSSDTDHDTDSRSALATAAIGLRQRTFPQHQFDEDSSPSSGISPTTGHFSAKIPSNISNKMCSHNPRSPPEGSAFSTPSQNIEPSSHSSDPEQPKMLESPFVRTPKKPSTLTFGHNSDNDKTNQPPSPPPKSPIRTTTITTTPSPKQPSSRPSRIPSLTPPPRPTTAPKPTSANTASTLPPATAARTSSMVSLSNSNTSDDESMKRKGSAAGLKKSLSKERFVSGGISVGKGGVTIGRPL